MRLAAESQPTQRCRPCSSSPDSNLSAVDSNGICNQGPCSEVACAGPTGDVDPLSTDYLKQAKAFASQYQPNVQVKGSVFDQLGGTTSGGALGGDVTGTVYVKGDWALGFAASPDVC